MTVRRHGMQLWFTLLIATMAATIVVIGGAAAFAQDAKVVKKIEDLNRAAMEDYDLLEFENAKKQLDEALGLVKKNKLTKHAAAGRTHFNMAIVSGGGLGNGETALLEFMAALEIDPKLSLDAAYKTPELSKLFEQARSTAGASAPPEPTPTSSGKSSGPATGGGSEIEGLVHTPVDEAPAGRNILISAKVGADVGASKVVVFFRPQGAESFRPLPMRATGGGSYQAEIPGAVTEAGAVHYYIEAKNAAGKVAAQNGTAGSPNIVMIAGAGGGSSNFDDNENPLGEEGGEGGGGDDSESSVDKTVALGQQKVYVAVSVGTGGGYLSGKTESLESPVGCCVAPAPFHLTPELGYWLTRDLSISAYARLGFVPGANIEGHASLAPAGLLRIGYYAGRHREFMLHGDLGGGFIRRTVKLEDKAPGMDVDTHAMGPLLLGGGGSWSTELNSTVRFRADGTILMGVPVIEEVANAKAGFGVNFDLSLGLVLAF